MRNVIWLRYVPVRQLNRDLRRLPMQSVSPSFFDTAGKAPESYRQLQRGLQEYSRLCDAGPSARQTRVFLQHGCSDIGFSGLSGVFRRLAQHFAVDPRRIGFHYNTTEAMRAAIRNSLILLDRRRGKKAGVKVLTTDSEYCSIYKLLSEELPADTQSIVLPVRRLLWEKGAECAGAEILSAADHFKPDLVLTSHVFRETGAVLPVEGIGKELETRLPGSVFLVDGAQAFGNIPLRPEVFRGTSFYVTSAHKHMMSLLLGIMVVGGLVAEELGTACRHVMPEYRYPLLLRDVDQSIDPRPLFALNVVLGLRARADDEIRAHNHRLAQCLWKALRAVLPDATVPAPHGCIVGCLLDRRASEHAHQRLSEEGIRAGRFDVGRSGVLRFAIHGNQGLQDINRVSRVFDSEGSVQAA